MLAATTDDGGAQALGAIQSVERRQQRADQLTVIGVVTLRPIEHDVRDATAVDVEEDGSLGV